ncbi:hypothetical protein NHF45_03335 [Maricaulaceae bacterium NA33B04]|nr:hypothetical protein [Maricaulaceae bacterium NA33B04]
MRILLKLLAGLFGLIVLGITAVFALPQWPTLQDRFGSGPYQAWLSENRTEINVANAGAIAAFDPEVYQSRFIILSEIHGYRAVQAIDLALVRHFAENGPGRTYLAELGPEQAMAFNHYLATGDEQPIRAVFDAWAEQTAQWGNVEFFQKLVAMRALNASLSDNRKIWFVGVDKLRSTDQLAALSAVLPEGVAAGFESFESVQALNAELGQLALERPEESGRYEHILPNIEHLVSVDPSRHFYGLWGLFHGTKTTVNGADPLALRLNRAGGAFEGSVTTFTTMCIDGCLNMMPARAMPSALHGNDNPDYLYMPISFDSALLQRVRGSNDVRASMGDASVTAFKVTGPESPYNDGVRLSELTGYMTMMQSFEYGGPASEVTDYFIAIRGSAGLTPWSGSVHDVSGIADTVGIPEVAEALN